jgi:hypothetical protein
MTGAHDPARDTRAVLEPEIAELERICALRLQHNCRSAIGAAAKSLMLTSLS